MFCFVSLVFISQVSDKGQFTKHCFIITTLWGAICTVWQTSFSEQKSVTFRQQQQRCMPLSTQTQLVFWKKISGWISPEKNSTQQQNQQIPFADLSSFLFSSLSWFPEEEPQQGIEGQEEHLFLRNSVITRNTAVGENFCTHTHTPRTEFGTHFFFSSLFFNEQTEKYPLPRKNTYPHFFSSSAKF